VIDIIVPLEQEGTKAVVRSWLRALGDMVAEHDPLVELETDKVTQEIPAPAAGVLSEILLASNAEATPGAVLGRLRPANTAASAEPARGPLTAPPPAFKADIRVSSELAHFLSPAVRKAVKEHRIDPAGIAGSGRGGRITRADVDQAVAARGQAPAPMTSIPHDRMRLAIAENMLNSVTVAPHVTAVFEADFSAIMAHQQTHKAEFEQQGAKLTYTAYIVSACVAAMHAVPALNSRWHADRVEIHHDINIGVGTALGDKGLVVPVVQRAQNLSLLEIATRLTDLISRARANQLTPADVRGGTFTISNHGVSGSLLAAPIIINQPQSAILGIGKLEKRVVVREVDGVDSIQIRPMCYVSLTIDHRVIDGHQTNAWLTSFVEVVQARPGALPLDPAGGSTPRPA
jgi:2-oxoglutarate dehydrogenase E2 component (dihydrolipoamide succinyltransferase)